MYRTLTLNIFFVLVENFFGFPLMCQKSSECCVLAIVRLSISNMIPFFFAYRLVFHLIRFTILIEFSFELCCQQARGQHRSSSMNIAIVKKTHQISEQKKNPQRKRVKMSFMCRTRIKKRKDQLGEWCQWMAVIRCCYFCLRVTRFNHIPS